MSDIEIVLREDNPVEPTKSRSWHISLPSDVAVKDLLAALIPKLGLPTQQNGRPIRYQLHHVRSGTNLSGNKTLSNAGVTHNDICFLWRDKISAAQPRKTHLDQSSNVALAATTRDIIAKSYALLTETCGRDGRHLASNERVVCCPLCGIPYHYQCWLANGSCCSDPGCEGRGTIHPQELIDQFCSMSEIIGNLMEDFPDELSSDLEEVFEALAEVDSQVADRWDELEDEESEDFLGEFEEEAEYEYGDELEEPQGLPVNIPSGLRYTQHHVWIDTTSGRVGITHFLAQHMFLILDVTLPEEGQRVTAGEEVSTIWATSVSMKDSDVPVFSPVSGVISAVNEKLKDRLLRSAEPELIQEDPYRRGWLFTIQLSRSARTELERLMGAEGYWQFIRSITGA